MVLLGRAWGAPTLLLFEGVCGVLFGASGMSCMWSIPGALYTQTSWPLFYVGKVFILHHLQRNAYLISKWESHCTNAHIVQKLAILEVKGANVAWTPACVALPGAWRV